MNPWENIMKSSEPVIALALLYHTKHNGVLEKVLESIKQLEYPKSKIHLILVDNVSTDGAHKIVENWLNKNRKEYLSIEHLILSGNVPHLRNICLKKAIEKKCDYIFFVDSDVILIPDAIERLIKIFNTNEKVFAASLPYFIPIEKDTLFVKIRTKYGKGDLKPLKNVNQPYQVPSIGMGATMIKLSYIPIVGYFDEEIPYIEDLNLTRRATNMGFKIIVDPQVQLLHDKHVKTFQWLKITLKIGKSEVKNMLRVGTWKKEIRSFLYWFSLLISILLIVIHPLFFIFLFTSGWIVYATRSKGLGKIVVFPIIAIYRITRVIGIIIGFILYFLEVIRK
jgi:GT2 family glycosyltransferase